MTSPADILTALASPAMEGASEAQLAAAVAREVRSRAAYASANSRAPATLSEGDRITSIRRRLILKYLGVDFELWGSDGVYRGNLGGITS
jgi:hypothetical protein